ncbi:MAG: YfhO family protein, partial [Chitinophagaceae bacterium]|nr:YfhO family protein [Chitinophagaceae bacterium]
AAIVLLIVSTIEITFASHLYFSNDKGPYENRQDQLFVPADDYTSSNFAKTAIDEQILKDTDPNYRVLNMAGTSNGGTFSESRTSYYHKSVGGYHPAKLRIYQDVIEKYMSGNTNQQVLNMLNTKYIIYKDPQMKQELAIPNPDAYGNCWLVKSVRIADDRLAAFKAIGTTNLKDTAVVDKSFSSLVIQPQADTTSTIKMTKFDNDAVEYEANCNGPQFAVFSEIYYPKGWNAYLDGKKVDYCNVNYILRGLSVPTGKHIIKFVFEPASVKKGTSIMYMASIAILISLLGGLFMAWKQSRKAN